MAVDQKAIIARALNGLGSPSCTDHSASYHPGFDPDAPCPIFDLTAANKLLDDSGWVRGSDGVRTQDGQRLEFEYVADHTRILMAPGYGNGPEERLTGDRHPADIQNYPGDLFYLLPQGKASPLRVPWRVGTTSPSLLAP